MSLQDKLYLEPLKALALIKGSENAMKEISSVRHHHYALFDADTRPDDYFVQQDKFVLRYVSLYYPETREYLCQCRLG